MGLGNTTTRNSPFPILSPYLPSSGRRGSQVMDHDGSLYSVKHLYGGGDYCLLLANTAEVRDVWKGSEVRDVWKGQEVRDVWKGQEVRDVWKGQEVRDVWKGQGCVEGSGGQGCVIVY